MPESDQPLPRIMAQSAAWALTGRLVSLAVTFVATPFLLRLLGSQAYGAWALIQALITYMVLADLGMSYASTKFAGDRAAADDAAGEAAVIWTSATLTTLLTSLAAALLVLAAPTLTTVLLGLPSRLYESAVIAIRLTALTVLARSVSGVLNTPQSVRLQWKWVTIANSGPSILQYVAAPIALLLTSAGLVAMATVSALSAMIAAALTIAVAVHVQPALRRPRIDSSLYPPLLRYGGGLTISALAAIPLMNGERFLLIHFHGAVAVAHYAVAVTLAGALSLIPTVATQPLFPALVKAESQGTTDSLRLSHQALTGIVLLMTPAVLFSALIAHPFLTAWAGANYGHYSTLPFYIIIIGLWFNALATVPCTRLLASGRTSTIAKLHLLELLPYLIIALFLTWQLGAIGAALAVTIRQVVDAFFFFFATRSHADRTEMPLPNHAARWLTATIGLLLAVLMLSAESLSLFEALFLTAALSTTYVLTVWFAVLQANERKAIVTLLHESLAIFLPNRSLREDC